jgi:hypothetical protein
MLQIETIEDRAYRILIDGSVTTPNIHVKPIMIPVLPFDGGGDGRLIRHLCPSEYRSFDGPHEREIGDDRSFYTSSINEDRLDFQSDDREHEEYLGDREHIVSIEDVKRSDQILLGYRDDDVVRISKLTHCRQKTGTAIPNRRHTKFDFVGDIQGSEHDSMEADDILLPISSPIITPIHSWERSRLSPFALKKSNSIETEVSSVFSSSSTLTTTPAILKLKARKRLLERFLSEKSLEALHNRNEGFEILAGSVETSC